MNNLKDVKKFLNANIKDGDSIVLACSGGPDSMCLLDLLLDMKHDKKIIVAHVHHNVRREAKKT